MAAVFLFFIFLVVNSEAEVRALYIRENNI
jgi:hypothetical protein